MSYIYHDTIHFDVICTITIILYFIEFERYWPYFARARLTLHLESLISLFTRITPDYAFDYLRSSLYTRSMDPFYQSRSLNRSHPFSKIRTLIRYTYHDESATRIFHVTIVNCVSTVSSINIWVVADHIRSKCEEDEGRDKRVNEKRRDL